MTAATLTKPDFSGWATKANLRCSDGRTITPTAFAHQDKMRVPLVWQHGHSNPENVLGHAILENRPDGVYAYCFFNNTPNAQHIKESVLHGDITALSIFANNLVEKAKAVLHGTIREVSLVLSGANPGALIDNIIITHSDDPSDNEIVADEAVIFSGETLTLEIEHSAGDNDDADDTDDVEHAAGDDDSDEDTLQDVIDSMSEKQQDVLHFMLGAALEAGKETATKEAKHDDTNSEGNIEMTRVFDQAKTKERHTISHDDMKSIIADTKNYAGSLKESVTAYALAHGIDDIDLLFPDAVAINEVPEFLKRRTDWVAAFMGGCRKTPFSRIKTMVADLTHEQARAKGYVKGSLKKEEYFGILRRVTTPTTVYKKQKLDRDDMVDITDFDVVVWLKGEMRLMLEEEIARAILIGDGRDVSSEDKINEQNIRPIASDNELYATTVLVNIGDASSSATEIIDAVIRSRKHYKGTGQPTFFTTETYISSFLLLKDSTGRRIYSSLDQLANELRVTAVIPVEVMEDEADLIGVIVNPIDYVIGATRGGQITTFEDFDIDYNQHKYLIETRMCGALAKVKSALVLRKTESTDVLISVVNAPTFSVDQDEVTIINTTNVVYKNVDTDATLTNGGSPYAVASGATLHVKATAAAGFFFENDAEDEWYFTNPN